MAEAEWRVVPGYEGRYWVSDSGTVFSRNVNRILKGTDLEGYRRVTLSREGKPKSLLVHRLVALAFLGEPPEPGMGVCHNDGNTSNNVLDNLRWDTHPGNMADKKIHGTARGRDILDADRVRAIRARYDAGEKPRQIHTDYPMVSIHTIYQIVYRNTWKGL